MRSWLIALLGLGLLSPSAGAEEPPAPVAPLPAPDVAAALRDALVKLVVNRQSYDLREPWKKGRVFSETIHGVVVAPDRILTLARDLRDALSVEVIIAHSARQYTARTLHMDTDVDLALVEVTDEGLRGQLKPLALGEPARLDEAVELALLGAREMVERYPGRVARVHAEGPILVLDLKTTLSESGDGQVCLREGKLVGLVRGTTAFRQEAQVVALETLRRYVDDVATPPYDGVPSSSFWIQTLLRDDLRAWSGVSAEQHGLLITRLMPDSAAAGLLEARDVVLAIDGHPLDDEGDFVHPVHGRLDGGWLLRGAHRVGEEVALRVLRGGAVTDVPVTLKRRAPAEQLVPERDSGTRPRFLVLAGLVVLEMHGDLRVGSGDGGVIIRRLMERADWDPMSRRRIVYVDHVLRDPANKGYDDLNQHAIDTVNGQSIEDLDGMVAALDTPVETPRGPFHVIRLMGVETDFVVDAQRMAAIDARIAKTYHVTLQRWLGEAPAQNGKNPGTPAD